jgi:sec-independent protein translocase protein TatA
MSLWHWLVVAAVVILLFGRGKISGVMGEFAQGIKAFKKGMAEEDDKKTDVVEVKPIPDQTVPPAPAATKTDSRVG